MAIGQQVFSEAADDAALAVLETRMLVQETGRSAGHAAQLRTVLEMDALYRARGHGMSTVPHAALSFGCSEHRAAALLAEAQALVVLPGALEAVECGLLTVEQSATVVRLLAVLPIDTREKVWRRLQARLVAEADNGSVLPPARLSELLRRWVQAANPDDATARRKKAEDGRHVDYRTRDDGLGDLFGIGFRAPDLHAILSRIAARSAPWGAGDERTAHQRRFDAFRDLLLGRDILRPEPDGPDGHGGQRGQGAQGGQAVHCAPGCGCRPGQPVPCGIDVAVHVPAGGALGTTAEPAELVGHGPIEADLLQEILLNAPRLRPVWVGPDGTVVAVGDQVTVPGRGDPQSVRDALLRLAAMPPPAPQPRHPHDHQPDRPDQPPGQRTRPPQLQPPPLPLAGLPRTDVPTSGLPHPPGTPGSYRPPRWLRRLINARAPRCEWPGCGARATRCDAEHDDAWPDGPTCACNLGPCCRRHHQVKQHGWTKTRTPDGVRWTARTGRTWLSLTQHPVPEPGRRPLPPVQTPSLFDELSPSQHEAELARLDLLPPDDWSNHHVLTDLDPDTTDRDTLGQRLRQHDTRWTLDLDDPYRWLDAAPLPAP